MIVDAKFEAISQFFVRRQRKVRRQPTGRGVEEFLLIQRFLVRPTHLRPVVLLRHDSIPGDYFSYPPCKTSNVRPEAKGPYLYFFGLCAATSPRLEFCLLGPCETMWVGSLRTNSFEFVWILLSINALSRTKSSRPVLHEIVPVAFGRTRGNATRTVPRQVLWMLLSRVPNIDQIDWIQSTEIGLVLFHDKVARSSRHVWHIQPLWSRSTTTSVSWGWWRSCAYSRSSAFSTRSKWWSEWIQCAKAHSRVKFFVYWSSRVTTL